MRKIKLKTGKPLPAKVVLDKPSLAKLVKGKPDERTARLDLGVKDTVKLPKKLK